MSSTTAPSASCVEAGTRERAFAGSADKCLWIEAQMLGPAKGAPRHDCAGQARRLRPSDFMSKWTGNYNRGPNQNCVWRTRDGGERRVRFCDGRTAQLNASACSPGAKAYANVKPWESGQPAEDYLGNGSTNRPFFQDWVFIPRGCISTSQLGHMRDPDY